MHEKISRELLNTFKIKNEEVDYLIILYHDLIDRREKQEEGDFNIALEIAYEEELKPRHSL